MYHLFKIKLFTIFLFSFLFLPSLLNADNHNISETLEQIKKDIQTLEKAVYSNQSISENTSSSFSNSSNSNSEDVLTRHLLKLSEIENQFQQLTNKFEEINF